MAEFKSAPVVWGRDFVVLIAGQVVLFWLQDGWLEFGLSIQATSGYLQRDWGSIVFIFAEDCKDEDKKEEIKQEVASHRAWLCDPGYCFQHQSTVTLSDLTYRLSNLWGDGL